MDVDRVQEILRSPNKVDVFYNGQAVWIDSVYPGSSTAQIHLMKDSSNISTVPVEKLNEK